MGDAANKKLGEFATTTDDYLHALITQPDVKVKQYKIKPRLLNLVQQYQFRGSAIEDAGMHLHTFTEICDMMRMNDVDPDMVKLRLYPFSLRGRAKEWLISLPRGTLLRGKDATIFL